MEGVLDKPTSDEVVVLSLKALELALLFVNRIVHILEIPFHIVPDWCAGSSFDLEDKGFAIFIIVTTVDLGTQEYVVIGDGVSVVVFLLRYNQLFLQTLDLLFLMGQKVLSYRP